MAPVTAQRHRSLSTVRHIAIPGLGEDNSNENTHATDFINGMDPGQLDRWDSKGYNGSKSHLGYNARIAIDQRLNLLDNAIDAVQLG